MADASLFVGGGVLAAHATGVTPVAPTDEVIERLHPQMRRTVGTELARRRQPAALREALSDLRFEVRFRPAVRPKPPEA